MIVVEKQRVSFIRAMHIIGYFFYGSVWVVTFLELNWLNLNRQNNVPNP